MERAEIQAAAERVRSFAFRQHLPPVEWTGLGSSPKRSGLDTAVILSPEDYDALLVVRNAYLVLVQPDDGEALDEAWLRSVGASEQLLCWQIAVNDEVLLRFCSDRIWFVEGVSEPDPDCVVIKIPVTTRGQLRDLCRVLQIPLREPTP